MESRGAGISRRNGGAPYHSPRREPWEARLGSAAVGACTAGEVGVLRCASRCACVQFGEMSGAAAFDAASGAVFAAR